MPDEPMTLVDRLRNPAWNLSVDPPVLILERVRADMEEAATLIENIRALLMVGAPDG